MKNLTVTYDTLQNGESGEACVSIPMDDEQAERIKAAFDGSVVISKREAFDLRDAVSGFVKFCERARGREYVSDSIKTVEVKEV